MNLLLFSAGDRLDERRIAVSDRRLAHLLQVHRAVEGDTLRVGEINGLTGDGRVLELNAGRAVLEIDLHTPPPDKLPVTLVLALPRPKMLRRIVRAAAELGIAHLYLVNSYRVEKSYWQTPVLRPEVLRDYLLQGLEQSRDTVLPAVHCERRFKPFVEDRLPGIIGAGRALLAHPGDFPPCPRDSAGPTVLVIGPEGGLIPYEVDLLQAAGCTPVSLGPRILRVENAIGFLLGRSC